ncbi:MAG: GH92 family glycosyl hydrolase [Saprospiraceae bacterium]
MYNRNINIFIIVLLSSSYLFAQNQTANKDFTKYVNPFIGTGSIDSLSLSGSNFPGAVVPFGFVQLSPDTDDNPEDPCSGYDYADNRIVGFSHTHLSGTGVADLFDFLFMPFRGEDKWEAFDNEDKKGYSSEFEHKNEFASPGYYKVKLDDPNIDVELTATEHCGMHRYSNISSDDFSVIIDIDHSLDKARPYWSCKIINSQIRIIDNHTIEGYREITGWANLRRVYFRAEFSQPFVSQSFKAGNKIYKNTEIANYQNLKAIFNFKNPKELIIKVGLSSVSYEGAQNNLKEEISDFDFDNTKNNANILWNKELSIFDISGTKQQKEIFYTALYHTFIHPINIADANGDYIDSNGEIKNASDGYHFSTFSLWDTYRAAHPLFTITQPKRTALFINSMLRQYENYGYLPIWQLWGQETYCMIGNHAIPVIVDAFNKNIPGINYQKAYDAILSSSSIPHRNSDFSLLDKYKYFPENIQSQSVSLELEIAYNDWCVANMSKSKGMKEDFNYYNKRSRYYENLFDKNIGFFRAKNSNGDWIEPFSPLVYGGNGGYPFTEGNGWQYLWYVPHDVNHFIQMMGGDTKFTAKLDEFFTLEAKPEDVNGNASGFIGQYAHGNEPSHHIAYLYDFTNEPWKAQYYTNKISKELYYNSPSGYSGNEDCGQMSAWYIFSAMGFYPVNPANGIYDFGSPQLKNVKINLENGKTFEITTHNLNNENIYIQKILFNGKPYKKNYITHHDIISGGNLEYFMGSEPNEDMKNYEKPPEKI